MDAPGFRIPASPFLLPQERSEVRIDPWRVLVASVLTFQVPPTREAAIPDILRGVLGRWPVDSKLVSADRSELITLVHPLGMQHRRAEYLIGLSLGYAMGWHSDPGCTVEALTGVGTYGYDAWRLFVEGRTDVRPTDRKLKDWLKWRIEKWGR